MKLKIAILAHDGMTRESAIKRSFFQFAIVYAIALLVVVREELVGALSPRELGIIGLSLMVGGWIFLTLKFRAINRNYKSAEQPVNNPATRKKIMRSIRTLRIGFVMMPVFLIYGLSVTSDLPIFLRITGVLINIWMTWSFYKAVRIQETKLRQTGNDDVSVARP